MINQLFKSTFKRPTKAATSLQLFFDVKTGFSVVQPIIFDYVYSFNSITHPILLA